MPLSEQAVWFAENVRRHEPELRALLSRRFSSLPDHDDLVQETYIRLWRLSGSKRLVHTRAFLFTVARNVAIDRVRQSRRTPVEPMDESAELALLEAAPDAAELLDRVERYEAILAAIEMLPDRCREVMLLRYVDGFTTQEIAVQLGLAAATVRVHLMKGVRDCAQFFRGRGLLEAAAPSKGGA